MSALHAFLLGVAIRERHERDGVRPQRMDAEKMQLQIDRATLLAMQEEKDRKLRELVERIEGWEKELGGVGATRDAANFLYLLRRELSELIGGGE